MSSAASSFVLEQAPPFVPVNDDGSVGMFEVPESCIESAEYLIQCCYIGKAIRWNSGSKRPDVFAHMGNAIINITATEDCHTTVMPAHGSYPFSQLPVLGEGIVLFNVGKDAGKGGYNMHFMAVVATGSFGGRPAVLVSNMMERQLRAGERTKMKQLQVLIVTDPTTLAAAFFGSKGKNYLTGLLSLSAGRDMMNTGGNLKNNTAAASRSAY